MLVSRPWAGRAREIGREKTGLPHRATGDAALFYYRYRPRSELTFKELLYDELFFASTSECNDPFDSRAFAEFSGDRDKWLRLLRTAIGVFAPLFGEDGLERIADSLAARAPLSLSEIANSDVLELAFAAALPAPMLRPLASGCATAVRGLVEHYHPPDRYFASFSTRNDDPLLWAHYADGHTGHCLIFRSVGGRLRVDPLRKTRPVERRGAGPIGPRMSFMMPDAFEFLAMHYPDRVKPACAFSLLPGDIYGEELDDDERTRLLNEIDRQFLEKHKAWEYEQETRLILQAPTPWLYGARHEPSTQQRLVHFDPTQLAGVIVGARADSKSRERIVEIVRTKRQYASAQRSVGAAEHITTDIVVFDADLGKTDRATDVSPSLIFGLSDEIDQTSESFQQRLDDWDLGWVYVTKDGKTTRKQLV